MPCCQCPDGAGVLLSHHKLLGLDLAQLTAGAKRPNFGWLIRPFLSKSGHAVRKQSGPTPVCNTTDDAALPVQSPCWQASTGGAEGRRLYNGTVCIIGVCETCLAVYIGQACECF